MSAICKRGVVLTLVIVAMSLVAVILLVLTTGASTMLFQADAAHCRAIDRNLAASGLAWAQSHAATEAEIAVDEPITLASDTLADGRATLTVEFKRIGNGTADIKITTSSRKGRHKLEESRDYAILWP